MRTAKERQDDTLYKLLHERDVWVATADASGRAHLVPFSLVWDGEHIIAATEILSRTIKNIRVSGQARLAIGDTRDVVIIEVQIKIMPLESASTEMGDLFLKRTGWHPRDAQREAYLLMTPIIIQAWKNEEELHGRTIMKDGIWIDS
ncbi:MAG TPA: pyridoxamine 5'-phosphate oxidase family protein [Candidatus Saccharimonadia bacterium]|nr:pyridoxamine 5'-phosphate oxidase family protein [Candidatus Saccharimonadia bacterium]